MSDGDSRASIVAATVCICTTYTSSTFAVILL